MILTAFLFSSFVQAQVKPNGDDFIRHFQKQVGPKSFAMSELPQNVGGDKPKLKLNQADELRKISFNLAISDEANFELAQEQTIFLLERAFQEKNFPLIKSVFLNAKEISFNKTINTSHRTVDNVQESKWTVRSSTKLNRISDVEKYLSEFNKIESVDFISTATITPLNQRDPKSYSPRYFKVNVLADIRGLDTSKKLRQDRFNLTFELENNQNVWQVLTVKLNHGETVTAPKATFLATNSFLGPKPENYLRKEAIRRGGYALSICDYDNDGLQDMFVGHMGALQIFKGQKNGQFALQDLKKLNVEAETLVKSISCNDFDNDGKKDLLLVRFAPNEDKGKDLVLYQNQFSKFKKQTTIHNRQPAFYAMPSAVADFNGDGLLDFYVGFPGAKDFTVLNKQANGFSGDKDIHPQGLFYNSGKFDFNEVSKEKIPYAKNKNPYTDGYPESSVVFPHTSAAIDYNLDGNVDIIVVDDKANLSPLYQNLGEGKFAQVAEKIGVTNFDFGMGFTAADLNNDGQLEFIYTNVNFVAAERLKNSLIENFSIYDKFPGIQGIRLFQSRDSKNYSDVTALSGIENTGYGVGGVETIDYNNDGYLDFYVPTGLWSGNQKHNDISSLFTRSYAKFDLDYQETVGTAEGIENANTSFMKILTDFRGQVNGLKSNSALRPSMEGFQRNRLFRNNKDGSFTEVGYLAGVDSISDGYVVATADLNLDGRMDLILRNADPGTEENKFDSVEIYMNQSKSKNKSVTLTLQGSLSNKDAIGAIVRANIGKENLIRYVMANNGAAQSQNLIHFGLGKNEKIDRIEIAWPSGQKEILIDVAPGHHMIVEKSKQISKNE